MANEITVRVSLAVSNAISSQLWDSGILSVDQTGLRSNRNVMAVTTGGGAQIAAGPLGGTLGYMMIKNLDTLTSGSGNLVYLLTTTGATTGAAISVLRPGDVALVRLGAGMQTPSLIAGSTACDVETMIFEL